MPKKKEAPADRSKQVSEDLAQFRTWKEDLRRYWAEMDRCQEMYEFYKSKSERSESEANVSLNTPFAIVESQIAKENQATMRITVTAKPEKSIGEFDEWVASVLKGAIEDPDVAEIHGTFRKTKEMFSRSLKVVGNAAAEINWCYKTEIRDGEKVVVADNPYVKTRHYKSVIFNPAMQFDRSDTYYVEDWVSLEDLKASEYKDGKGTYSNLDELSVKLKGKDGLRDDSDVQYVSGDRKVSRKTKPVQVITKWKGNRMTVYATAGSGDGTLIRDAVDPMKLGGHNLLLAMRYQVEGRPYAYGEISAIYKPVRAQDTIVSQSIEIVNKYLRGSYVLGTSNDIDQFMMVLANGGAMYGDVSAIANVPVNVPPSGAFQSIDVLQQAIERAARFSLYGSGLSGQSTDKTQGTASGIQSIQAAAEPNVEIQLEDIEDMFMRPLARKYLKMIGRLMGEDESRYGLLEGENPEWVRATKGILTGKATIQDFVMAGLLDAEEAQGFLTAPDPVTGAPMPIPGANEAFVFDVDWLVDVKLDNQSASDRESEIQKQMGTVDLAMKMGVQLSPERTATYFANATDFDEFESLMLTEQEKQKQQMQVRQQQESQMAQEQSQQSAQASQDQGSQQADIHAKMAMQQAQQDHQVRLEGMRAGRVS